MHFELSEIASCDANLFFTVGRFMAKGYRPYLDAYENKPPMIFLISEISYLLSGGFYLVNISSFLCFLNLLLTPLAICIIIAIKRKLSLLSASLMSGSVFLISLLLLFYSEQRSGEIMCEIFGVSALVDGVLCLLIISKGKKIHFYHPCVILSGVFFAIATLFKEPFALLGIFAYLMVIEQKRDLLFKLVFPLAYGVFTALLILLVTNSVAGYFTIYLPNMLSYHITSHGSLFDRMKDFKKLFDNLNEFSKYLFILIILMFFISCLRGTTLFSEEKPSLMLIFRVIRIILPFVYLYIASLTVGLGGQYFWHHFAFALPFYYSLLLDSGFYIGEQINNLSIKDNEGPLIKKISNPFTLLAVVFTFLLSFISSYGLIEHKFKMKEEEMINLVKRAKADASYIDEVLDTLNVERYLFIGFNGTDRPYCYTKHLPLGPCFVQDQDNFKKANTFFTNNFLKQLKESEVIVFSSYQMPIIEKEVKQYISTNFTSELPNAIKDISKPEQFFYGLYFRI